MLPELGPSSVWTLIILMLWGLVRSRRELVWLVLGLAFIIRGKRKDLPDLAQKIFDQGCDE